MVASEVEDMHVLDDLVPHLIFSKQLTWLPWQFSKQVETFYWIFKILKTNHNLGCIKKGKISRSKRWFSTLILPLGDPAWSTASNSGALRPGRTCWSKSRGEPWRWSESQNIFYRKTGWERWCCSAWRRLKGDLIEAFQYLKGLTEKVESNLYIGWKW